MVWLSGVMVVQVACTPGIVWTGLSGGTVWVGAEKVTVV